MRETEKLKRLLHELRDDRQASGNGAYAYIDYLLSYDNRGASGETEVLRQIKSSAKLVDLAGFSAGQGKAWLNLWREATRLLAAEVR